MEHDPGDLAKIAGGAKRVRVLSKSMVEIQACVAWWPVLLCARIFLIPTLGTVWRHTHAFHHMCCPATDKSKVRGSCRKRSRVKSRAFESELSVKPRNMHAMLEYTSPPTMMVESILSTLFSNSDWLLYRTLQSSQDLALTSHP